MPSLDDVMSLHFPGLALDVHVSPKSVDVQMFPPWTTAASLIPSLDDVMDLHVHVVLSVGLTSFQLAP